MNPKIDDLSRAIEVDPSNTMARIQRGVMLSDLGQNAAAAEDLRIVILSDGPLKVRALHLLSLCVCKLGQLDEGLNYALMALECEPENAWLFHSLGLIQSQRHDFAAAVTALSRALELDDGLVDASLPRGRAFQSLGMLDAAAVDFDRACGAIPLSSDAFCCRGMLHLRRGNLIQAKMDLLHARELEITSQECEVVDAALKICEDKMVSE